MAHARKGGRPLGHETSVQFCTATWRALFKALTFSFMVLKTACLLWLFLPEIFAKIGGILLIGHFGKENRPMPILFEHQNRPILSAGRYIARAQLNTKVLWSLYIFIKYCECLVLDMNHFLVVPYSLLQ